MLPVYVENRLTNFDKIFNDFLGLKVEGKESLSYKLVEKEDYYLISILIPGVSKDKLNLEIDGCKLNIQIESNSVTTWDRLYSSSPYTIRLPKDCSSSKVDAILENGILEVKLFKLSDKLKKKIPIS